MIREDWQWFRCPDCGAALDLPPDIYCLDVVWCHACYPAVVVMERWERSESESERSGV